MLRRLYVIGGLSRTGKSKIARHIGSSLENLLILGTDAFRPNGNDTLAWLNLVDYLTKNKFNSDVLIEGVAITPEKVNQLNLVEFSSKAVFLGFGRESHANSILTHAEREKANDWLYIELQAGRYTEAGIRNSMKGGIEESTKLKREAEKYGYGYFDITDYMNFDEYIRNVTNYLLNEKS